MGSSIEQFRNKTVLVTGHTGFKGSWISIILRTFGARVIGISLDNAPRNSIYHIYGVSKVMEAEYFLDIRDEILLKNTMVLFHPDYIFHFAAQSLVLTGYQNPRKTFETNLLGTFNILENALNMQNLVGISIATSDKVYRNHNLGIPFTEASPLGGLDPYSASKAATEILVDSFRHSFRRENIQVTTVRSGNVIGGGDYSAHRIFPDIIRAIESKSILKIRNPKATRPWLHVLDSLSGYLLQAKSHLEQSSGFENTSLNLGPTGTLTVEEVLNLTSKILGPLDWHKTENAQHLEAKQLDLTSDLAFKSIGWNPIFSLEESINHTANWYRAFLNNEDMWDFTNDEIANYFEL
jgi:CDP-glucose 4,6-dehydratase